MKLTSGDSCRVYLIQDLARIHGIPISPVSVTAQSGCRRRGVSDRQERKSAKEVDGNGDQIYFAHDFLVASAQQM